LIEELITQPVTRGNFMQDVSEQGELASSSNVEIRCLVKSRNTPGTAIISIVPEGTYVKKGENIVQLDPSALEQEKMQQTILVNTSKAVMIQSKNVYDLAVISKAQYLDGEFRELEQTLLSEQLVAEENLRRGHQVLEFSKKMAAKGYSSLIELEANRYGLDKAKMDLNVAKTKLDVLRNYTKTKMLTQLETDILTAEAKWRADESSNMLDVQKLKEINDQISKCTINAPTDGQVVYDKGDGWRDNEVVIEEGALMRERQIICRLPDPTRMQVDAEINESRIGLIKVGLTASVQVDAFPDLELRGRVTKVNDYPEDSRWSNTKEYLATVEILDDIVGLRPGMTAEARIHVESVPDVLQVPVQAVVEQGGHHYCLVRNGKELTPRAVKIGFANDKYVVIKNGLKEDELVAVNARNLWSQIEAPDILPVPDIPTPNVQVASRQVSADIKQATIEVKKSDSPAAATSGDDNSRKQGLSVDDKVDGKIAGNLQGLENKSSQGNANQNSTGETNLPRCDSDKDESPETSPDADKSLVTNKEDECDSQQECLSNIPDPDSTKPLIHGGAVAGE